MTPDWIALDWGTSNLRAWAMDGSGSILAEASAPRGMGGLAPDEFEGVLRDLIADWTIPDPCPVIACGMVGSRQGWVDAGYRTVPSVPLSGGLARVAGAPGLDVRIVPGLSQADPADVMRGEETQIAGFLSFNPHFDGTLVLPGTHTKWVQLSAGEVVSFQTAMTGEIYRALFGHTVLRHAQDGAWDEGAFLEAVSDGLSRPEALATRAFRIRAEGLLTGLAPGVAGARLSGLLIGAELAHARPYWLGLPLAIVGDPKLGGHYAAALRAQGANPLIAKADACTLAGLKAARKLAKDT